VFPVIRVGALANPATTRATLTATSEWAAATRLPAARRVQPRVIGEQGRPTGPGTGRDLRQGQPDQPRHDQQQPRRGIALPGGHQERKARHVHERLRDQYPVLAVPVDHPADRRRHHALTQRDGTGDQPAQGVGTA
jgi:hypothetical protein